MTLTEIKNIIKDIKQKSKINGKRFNNNNMQLLTEFCESDYMPNEQYFEIARSYFNFVKQYQTFSTDKYIDAIGKEIAKQL